MRSGAPNRYAATERASSVLPTPDGPTNSSDTSGLSAGANGPWRRVPRRADSSPFHPRRDRRRSAHRRRGSPTAPRAHLLQRRESGSSSNCEMKSPRTIRRDPRAKLFAETVFGSRLRRSGSPPYGSTSRCRRAGVPSLIVKSRRARSSSAVAGGRRRSRSRAGLAPSTLRAAAVRAMPEGNDCADRTVRGSAHPTAPGDNSSSVRRASSAARSPAMSTPGTRKSASFDSTPSSPSRTALPTWCAEVERPDVVLDPLGHPYGAVRSSISTSAPEEFRLDRRARAWRSPTLE